MNQVIEKGYISNKNMKVWENTESNTYSTQLISSQYMGKGKGYEGSDYTNIFINVNINSKLTNGLPPQEGLYVLVIGQLRQDKKQENGFTTRVSVQEIYQISKLNYGVNTSYQVHTGAVVKEVEQPTKLENDSILWED